MSIFIIIVTWLVILSLLLLFIIIIITSALTPARQLTFYTNISFLFTHKYAIMPAGKGDAEWLNAQPGAGSLPVMTSGNGNNAPMVTGSTPQNGESKLPQAIVKPQILTHFIEGFVIQEGAEPFPVSRILKKLSTHWAHGSSEAETHTHIHTHRRTGTRNRPWHF